MKLRFFQDSKWVIGLLSLGNRATTQLIKADVVDRAYARSRLHATHATRSKRVFDVSYGARRRRAIIIIEYSEKTIVGRIIVSGQLLFAFPRPPPRSENSLQARVRLRARRHINRKVQFELGTAGIYDYNAMQAGVPACPGCGDLASFRMRPLAPEMHAPRMISPWPGHTTTRRNERLREGLPPFPPPLLLTRRLRTDKCPKLLVRLVSGSLIARSL